MRYSQLCVLDNAVFQMFYIIIISHIAIINIKYYGLQQIHYACDGHACLLATTERQFAIGEHLLFSHLHTLSKCCGNPTVPHPPPVYTQLKTIYYIMQKLKILNSTS